MIQSFFSESEIEEASLKWFKELEYLILDVGKIAPGELLAEREKYEEVILHRRLRDALVRLNPGIPAEAIEEAFRKIIRAESPSLLQNNHAIHWT